MRIHDGLALFFAQDFIILVIAYVDLTLGIVDAAAVAATFTRTAATTFIAPTVASTGLNSGNLSGKLVLWHIGYRVCESISRLQICNDVKVSSDFKSLDCVL